LAIFWPRWGVCPLASCRIRREISVKETTPSIVAGIVVIRGASASSGVEGYSVERGGPEGFAVV
jgi:hypothetical protein